MGDILIAVNPFKALNHFTPQESKQYRSRGMKTLPPHPYLIIDEAYNDMINKKKDQSILISGESGAGKTYTVRVCMAYVSEVAGSPAGVEKKVMATNRVLESFGNAKTLRNDNSSRFGKFIQLYFDHSYQIVGCAIENYLLEKSRICFQQPCVYGTHLIGATWPCPHHNQPVPPLPVDCVRLPRSFSFPPRTHTLTHTTPAHTSAHTHHAGTSATTTSSTTSRTG